MKQHTINVGGNKTSISLEPEFWAEFKAIAAAKQWQLVKLVDHINLTRNRGNLSSAVRIYILGYLKEEKTT
jgi:predicted DNA-binding ribbon-helix-helix protein